MRMKLVLLACAFLLAPFALAQQSSAKPADDVETLKARLDEMQKTITDMQAKLAELEKRKAAAPASANSETVKTETAKPSTDTKKEAGKLTFSGKAYLGYMDGFRPDSPARFDLFRGYFGGVYQMSPKVSLNFTMDMAARRQDSTGPFAVVLKKMFLNYQFAKNHQLMFGQIDLPWVVFLEDTQGFRFIGKTFVEEEGYLSSADLGMAVKGSFAKGVLRYQINVANGVNWTAVENDSAKDMHGLLVLTPFARSSSRSKNLFVSVGGTEKFFGSNQVKAGEATSGYRLNAMIGYRSDALTITAERLSVRDPESKVISSHPSAAGILNAHGNGFSFFAHARPIKAAPFNRLGLMVRTDYLDPTSGRVLNDSSKRYIVGPSWKQNGNLQFWTGYIGLRYDANAGVKVPRQNYLGFFAEAKF
jgi:hypothetical protein